MLMLFSELRALTRRKDSISYFIDEALIINGNVSFKFIIMREKMGLK